MKEENATAANAVTGVLSHASLMGELDSQQSNTSALLGDLFGKIQGYVRPPPPVVEAPMPESLPPVDTGLGHALRERIQMQIGINDDLRRIIARIEP